MSNTIKQHMATIWPFPLWGPTSSPKRWYLKYRMLFNAGPLLFPPRHNGWGVGRVPNARGHGNHLRREHRGQLPSQQWPETGCAGLWLRGSTIPKLTWINYKIENSFHGHLKRALGWLQLNAAMCCEWGGNMGHGASIPPFLEHPQWMW